MPTEAYIKPIYEKVHNETTGEVSQRQILPRTTTEAVYGIENYQEKLTAGTGIEITADNVINNTQTSAEWGNIEGNMEDQTDLENRFKTVEGQLDNIKNLGRFLSIWDCTTGLPTTEPPRGVPFNYSVGDYYRVGSAANEGGTNYKPNGSQYTGDASTTEESEEVTVGAVYYYDGELWAMQAAGAGGKVQDVQINGTSIVENGVANITTDGLDAVSYNSQTRTEAEKLQARTNIGTGVRITDTADPQGDVEMVDMETMELVEAIAATSSHNEVATAKAVYDAIAAAKPQIIYH